MYSLNNSEVDNFKCHFAFTFVLVVMLGLLWGVSGALEMRHLDSDGSGAQLWLARIVGPFVVWLRSILPCRLNGRDLGQSGLLKWVPFGTLIANVSGTCVTAALATLMKVVQFCYILWAIGCILLYPVSAEAMPNPGPKHWRAPKLRANQIKEILGGIVLFVILVGIFIWWFIRHWRRTRNRRIVDSFQLVSYRIDAAIAFEATECTICLEEFVEGVRLILLPCKHIYHPDCLRIWMISRRPHCPNCGRDYTSGGAGRPAS